MIRLLSIFILLSVVFPAWSSIKTTRQERLDIKAGNQKYAEGEFAAATDLYKKALEANPSSVYAGFNLSLAELKLSKSVKDEKGAQAAEAKAMERLQNIAGMSGEYSHIASLANYNLGNIAFRKNDFGQAINYYKQSLRLNPDDSNARRNLRIAQLKQQQNDKNKDQNKDKDKDQNKDQNKDQDKDKDKDKDKNQNNDQNKDKQNKPQDEKINPAAADRILKAMENKENATRARLQKKDAQKQNQQRSRKNW